MSTTNPGLAGAFKPTDFGKLVDLAVKARSVASRTATTVTTENVSIAFPKWLSDPAVNWLAELEEITATDGGNAEVTVTPKKVGGISRISLEAASDTSPDAANLLGKGLANQIGRSLDAAYLGSTVSDGPSGLLSIAYTPVSAGASLTDLDPFISARYAAEANGSQLTSWIVRPSVAEELSKLRVQTGSNQNLIAFVEDGITVCGLPVLVSDQVDATTVAFGIPREHVVVVLRTGTLVERFPAVYNVGFDIRAVARYGLGFLNEPGVVRIMKTPITYTLNFNGATGGTATVSVNGHLSATTVAFNAANTAVKTAIVAADDGIEAASVTVTGSAGVYQVTLPGVLTASGASLTGGTPSATATVTVV